MSTDSQANLVNQKLSLDVYKSMLLSSNYGSMKPWVSSPPSTAFVAVTIRWRELGRICWRLFSKSSVQAILVAKICRCFMRISLFDDNLRKRSPESWGSKLETSVINLPLLGTFALCQEILTAVCLCLSNAFDLVTYLQQTSRNSIHAMASSHHGHLYLHTS